MRIRRFEAASFPEAFRTIKAELGPEAVIISSRKVRAGANPLVEVSAAVEYEAPLKDRGRERDGQRQPGSQTSATLPGGLDAGLRSLRLDLAALREIMLGAEMLRSELAGGGAALYGWLAGRGLAQELALRLVRQLGGTADIGLPDTDPETRRRLLEALGGLFQTGGFDVPLPRKNGKKPEVIALVGPTGVGKTTTIAKLAARLALKDRLKVGLVSCDGYRLGAPDQARSFARVLGLPLSLCGSERELPTALAKHRDRDVVLVDTAGRSPNDPERLAEISALADVGARCHLVLSATKRDEEIFSAQDRFGAEAACSSLIFTKLDEAGRCGAVLNAAHRSGLPVSWLGTGQCIPDDLEPATAAVVAGLLLLPGRGSERGLAAAR